MDVRHLIAVCVMSAVVSSSASAQSSLSPALHDIPWYQAHGAAREATTRLCHSDHSYRHNVDCMNAETAGTLDWGRRSANAARGASNSPRHGNDLFPQLSDPSYWAQNGLARFGVIAACNNPTPGYAPSTCAAARQGAALANRHPS